jgi:L-threonylcarbamoyladenylate synthase
MNELKVFDLRSIPVNEFDSKSIIGHLQSGGFLVYPTETVYGFGGIPTDDVVLKLCALKSRGSEKPMLILIPRKETVDSLVWTEEALQLADVFWPGPITLVLADPYHLFPSGIRSESGSVAVRISPNPIVKALVEGLDGPLLSTSANEPGRPPALDASYAMKSAHRLGMGPKLWVVDVGTIPNSLPSTIVDCSGTTPIVIRQGTIPINRVRSVIPGIEAKSDE